MSERYWLGVDLGGTKILVGLFDDALTLVARAKHPTGADGGPSGVFANVATAVATAVKEADVPAEKIAGMGFAIPGQIEPGTTLVRFAPNLNWRDVDAKAHSPAEWTWPVALENDVRMGTFGEFSRGAAQGARHVFGIFAGTGVGGGFILNGELFTGFKGNAGEIGHVVMHWGKGTTLEDVAGRKSQMKRAKKMLDDAPKRVRKGWKGVDFDKVKSSQLAELYEGNDPIATTIVDDAARAIGGAIASVVNLISPQVVVLGGGVTEALGESFVERVWEFAQRNILPGAADGVKYVQAALGDDSGIVGAAAYARAKLGAK